MSWDPEVYLRYEAYRTRPAKDLLAQVPIDDPDTVYDLGCGPGNSTRLLADRYPKAGLVGIDSSAEMLEKARQDGPAQVQWRQEDLADWQPEPADLFFSNATLHWVPGPERLLKRLMGALSAGGVLALQVPDNFDAPSHRLIPEALDAAGLSGKGLWDEDYRYTLSAQAYYEVLSPLAEDLTIWDTDYLYVLDGEDPVYHWTRGTALGPILSALSDADKSAFVAAYTDRLNTAYPVRPDGHTLFPFKRRFVVAKKG